MAEKPNVRVAIFVADNTSMCGVGSDGSTALLSACSLVRCGSHQFVSPGLRCRFRALLRFVRSVARYSQDIVSMSTAYISLTQTYLYRRWGRPVVLLPNASSP